MSPTSLTSVVPEPDTVSPTPIVALGESTACEKPTANKNDLEMPINNDKELENHFFSSPNWYALGSAPLEEGGALVMNDTAVRARAGLLHVVSWVLILDWVQEWGIVIYVAPVVIFEFFAAATFGLTPVSPFGTLATLLTWNLKPSWGPAAPKRFAWSLGVCMATGCACFSNVVLNIRSVWIIILTGCCLLTWMECALGFCLGCFMYGHMERFGIF